MMDAKEEVLDPAPSPFDEQGVQRAWDSTSLSWRKKCAQLWKYSMIDGYRLPDEAGTAVDLFFGQVYHTALEHYYKLTHAGASHNEAVRLIIREALTLTWLDGKPWESGDTNKTRETLIRSIIWYFESFDHRTDNAKTITLANGKPAVELSFRFDVGGGYMLSGHLDRVVDFLGDIYVMDHKTTTKTLGPYYFRGYSPHNQMTLYTIASQIAYATPAKGVIVDAAQVAVNFTRFERGFASRQAPVLQEWLDDFHYIAEAAARDVLNNRFPKSDDFCVYCAFKDVCNADPRMRQKMLDSNFVKKHWNPLEVR
jgi:hypothetical protein